VLASEMTPAVNSPLNRGPELVTVKPAANAALHAEEAARGAAYAAERAEREALLQRPMFAMPTRGIFTSGFGFRWGALHDGIDVAGPIGTPVYAASDGIVKEAGATNSGYGAWVLITHADGTVTRYGHINSWNVQVGQRVFAGDQIATVGNRGNSTGPHLHFSVLLGGTNATDPVSWLAARGVSVGPYTG
jgi:murein DD-endopeptidase MepM/ murein hydrolase activator NlpD